MFRRLISNTGSSAVQVIIVLAAMSVILAVVFVLFRDAIFEVGAHAVNSIQADIIVPDN